MADPDGRSVIPGRSVIAAGRSTIATPHENSSLVRSDYSDNNSGCNNINKNTAYRIEESKYERNVPLSPYHTTSGHQQRHGDFAKPVNRQRSDSRSVLRPDYHHGDHDMDRRLNKPFQIINPTTPELDETSVTSGTERHVEALDISQRSAPSPAVVRPRTTTTATAAVVPPPSPPPPRPIASGTTYTRTGSSGSSSGSAGVARRPHHHNHPHTSSYPSSGTSASEGYENNGGDGSGELFEVETTDSFRPEDSVLNSILQEQYRNSIIRLPFVPAVVTGQDTTVEPSIEPQVPIAVAPISFRHVENDHSLIQTPMPPRVMNHGGNSGVHNALEPGSGKGGLPIKQLTELRQQGFPVGLALEVSDSRKGFPVRFWSIDNCAGMNEGDCKQVKFNPDGRTTVEKCSRWNELQGTVEDQIRLMGLMNVNSLFCLRNGERGNRKFSVADPTSRSVENDVKLAVRSVKESQAGGGTPISKHLREFTSRVELLESTLRKQNQKAVCIFSVGSLPTDSHGHSSEQTKEQFLNALTELGRLPVWIFIRLCTKDEDVTEFYNNLTLTGLPLVVIGKSIRCFCINKR